MYMTIINDKPLLDPEQRGQTKFILDLPLCIIGLASLRAPAAPPFCILKYSKKAQERVNCELQ